MCPRNLHPISIVEGGGFNFCKELNPSYDVPGRTTISNYVSLAYDQLKTDLIKTISSQPGVSLTTDHWTSIDTEGYITVTGHFIDEVWKFNNCVLAARKTTEKHSVVNIHTDLKNVCREFPINAANFTSLVTDNASNMVSCATLLPNNITHVKCFGHTLQLSIRGSFDKAQTITRTIEAAKHLTLAWTASSYEGGSICNENPFITPSTNSLGFNASCQTKDQNVAVIMVHEALFYLSNFNKLQTF